jgi:hypothetical protein
VSDDLRELRSYRTDLGLPLGKRTAADAAHP